MLMVMVVVVMVVVVVMIVVMVMPMMMVMMMVPMTVLIVVMMVMVIDMLHRGQSVLTGVAVQLDLAVQRFLHAILQDFFQKRMEAEILRQGELRFRVLLTELL